jgi:hypothetical protein
MRRESPHTRFLRTNCPGEPPTQPSIQQPAAAQTLQHARPPEHVLPTPSIAFPDLSCPSSSQSALVSTARCGWRAEATVNVGRDPRPARTSPLHNTAPARRASRPPAVRILRSARRRIALAHGASCDCSLAATGVVRHAGAPLSTSSIRLARELQVKLQPLPNHLIFPASPSLNALPSDHGFHSLANSSF